MKIMPLFFFLFAIQITLMLFVTSTLTNDGKQVVFNDSQNGSFWNPLGNYNTYTSGDGLATSIDAWGNTVTTKSQDFWEIIFNPSTGNRNLMLTYFVSFALLIGALAFFPFINRSDLSMLSGPFLFILLAPTPVFIQLYSFINSQASAFVGDVSQVNFIGQFLAVLVTGPLFLAWALACWENWTGRPVS